MKILVTGGAGYIGTELVYTLAQQKSVTEIIVFDNLSRINHNLFINGKMKNYDKVTFVKGDLLDSRLVKKVLLGVDVVYHLAAKVTTPFANTDPHFFEQVNHWGTAELVYAIENSDVRKFIYTSSTSVYGSSKKAVDELTTPNPKTFYGISKLRGEEHVTRLSHKMDTLIFRCGNVYGYSKSMRFDAVINKFVFEANFSKRITINGDGRQHRSFIHIDQIKNALVNVLDCDLKTGVYNLVKRDLLVLDVVDTLKHLIPELEFNFVNQHLKLRELKVMENQEITNKLKLDSNQTFEEELKQFRERFSF